MRYFNYQEFEDSATARRDGIDNSLTPVARRYEIKEYFIKALNRLITEKDEIIANTEMIRKMLCDNSELEAKRDALQEEIAVTVIFKDGTEMKAE